MQVTEHFNLAEFHCKDGTPYPSEWIEKRLKPLCEALEKIRDKTHAPLQIVSAYRTPAHTFVHYDQRGIKARW